MKQWMICLSILIALGATGDQSERLPASENECPAGESLSLYETIQSIVGKYRDATVSFIGNSANNFNLRPFMGQTSFGDSSTYEGSFFSNMSSSALTNYHTKVMELQDHHASRLANSWAPNFNTNGDITNAYYGFGDQTSNAINYMYASPVLENPYMPTVSYYTAPARAEMAIDHPNTTPEYFGPQ